MQRTCYNHWKSVIMPRLTELPSHRAECLLQHQGSSLNPWDLHAVSVTLFNCSFLSIRTATANDTEYAVWGDANRSSDELALMR